MAYSGAVVLGAGVEAVAGIAGGFTITEAAWTGLGNAIAEGEAALPAVAENGCLRQIGEYLAVKASVQVQPGINQLSGQIIVDIGNIQPWKAFIGRAFI